jgi:hypothetical protein
MKNLYLSVLVLSAPCIRAWLSAPEAPQQLKSLCENVVLVSGNHHYAPVSGHAFKSCPDTGQLPVFTQTLKPQSSTGHERHG